MCANRLLATVAVILMGGHPLRAQGPPLAFTPQSGFGGRSEGNGTLRLFGRSRPFHVESAGSELPGAAFRLDQAVSLLGEGTQNRTWVIGTVGPGQYAGTLSDAAGTVTGRTEGSRLFLRYRVKGPFVVRQTLELMPGGKAIDNVGRITLLGVPVGRLRETIVRED